MATLTDKQIANYEQDGFIVIENAVPADVLSRLQNVTHELIDQSRTVTQNNDIYELAAADAWPISGALSAFSGMGQQALWEYFNKNMVCGTQSITPRLKDVPVVMPLPPPNDASSIFQTQSSGGAKSAFAASN